MAMSQESGNWSAASEDMLRRYFPVHRACRDGDIEQLASLLSAGEVDLYEEDDFYGWSPIHWAAYFGKLACLRRLVNCLEGIANGCDMVSSRFSQSPAHLSAFGGHPQCLYWLVQSKCDLNLQDYMGETPIHKAARTGSMECVSLLVSQGAGLNIKNYSDCLPSEVAADAGYADCARYLERAAQLQNENQPATPSAINGINSSLNTLSGRTSPEGQPSGQHFISTNTYHSHPHVAINGTSHHPHIENGFNNNNQSEDCDMEMEDGPQQVSQPAMQNGSAHVLQNGDVLLNHGVSQNLIPLAGRKRGREDVDEDSYKRARQDEPMSNKCKLNGWLFNNGHMTDQLTNHMGDHVIPVSNSMVEHYTSVSMQEGYDSLMLNSVMNK